jgi:hypothetical protein
MVDEEHSCGVWCGLPRLATGRCGAAHTSLGCNVIPQVHTHTHTHIYLTWL